MDYKQKYLKYKAKYLELRNMRGGNGDVHVCDAVKCKDVCLLNLEREKQLSHDEGFKKGAASCTIKQPNETISVERQPHAAIGHLNDITKAAPDLISNVGNAFLRGVSVFGQGFQAVNDTRAAIESKSVTASDTRSNFKTSTSRSVSPKSKQARPAWR